MKKTQFLLMSLILMTGFVHAQKRKSDHKTNVLVRQSFESTDQKSEPATLLITLPYQTSASYAVDGGVALERESSRTSHKIVVEYHRNTLIEKAQNNGQVGYSGDFYLKVPLSTNNYLLTATAKYIRDIVATKGSFLQTSEIAPISSAFNSTVRLKRKHTNESGDTIVENSISYFLFSPSVGYEYQNTFDAKQENLDSLRGTVFRGMAKLKASYTFSKRLSSSVVVPVVQVYASGALRYDLANKTKTPNGWHPYLQTGVDYIVTRNADLDPRLAVGVSFTTGENPTQGLARQKFWLLAVRFTL